MCRRCYEKWWDRENPGRKPKRTPEALAARAQRAKEAPFKQRRAILASHGITLAEYDERLVSQGGVCAICRQPEAITKNGKVQALAVDHDHKCCPGDKSCGKCVRALLCYRCNMLIGYARESADYLRAAANYVGGAA